MTKIILDDRFGKKSKILSVVKNWNVGHEIVFENRYFNRKSKLILYIRMSAENRTLFDLYLN